MSLKVFQNGQLTDIEGISVQANTVVTEIESDVNFYDYDGTLVKSYTATEFANISAMPENPTHEGLTAQGWNWSLADAKTYVSTYGKLSIGQMYITDDGATRLHIHLEDGRLSPVLGLCPNGTLSINWGDDSANETMSGSSTSVIEYLSHTYAQAGDYTISVMPLQGSTFGFGQRDNRPTILCSNNSDDIKRRRPYLATIINVNIGSGVTSLVDHAFHECYSLVSVTMPNGITDINGNAFNKCYSLISITIPSNVVSLNDRMFDGCVSLFSISMPSGITTMDDYTFNNCYSLSLVTIPEGVTVIGNSMFANCYRLTNVTIPNGVSGIPNSAFTNCYMLTSVIIPNEVTHIDYAAFNNGYILNNVTIPNKVANIYSNAFAYCSGLQFIKFMGLVPPTLAANSAFGNISTDCIIYAPALVLNLYLNGRNYPVKSSFNYIGYATYESGVTLPDKTADETHTLTWYATVDDAIAETNPITVGNGNEVYARATAI